MTRDKEYVRDDERGGRQPSIRGDRPFEPGLNRCLLSELIFVIVPECVISGSRKCPAVMSPVFYQNFNRIRLTDTLCKPSASAQTCQSLVEKHTQTEATNNTVVSELPLISHRAASCASHSVAALSKYDCLFD